MVILRVCFNAEIKHYESTKYNRIDNGTGDRLSNFGGDLIIVWIQEYLKKFYHCPHMSNISGVGPFQRHALSECSCL